MFEKKWKVSKICLLYGFVFLATLLYYGSQSYLFTNLVPVPQSKKENLPAFSIAKTTKEIPALEMGLWGIAEQNIVEQVKLDDLTPWKLYQEKSQWIIEKQVTSEAEQKWLFYGILLVQNELKVVLRRDLEGSNWQFLGQGEQLIDLTISSVSTGEIEFTDINDSRLKITMFRFAEDE